MIIQQANVLPLFLIILAFAIGPALALKKAYDAQIKTGTMKNSAIRFAIVYLLIVAPLIGSVLFLSQVKNNMMKSAYVSACLFISLIWYGVCLGAFFRKNKDS